MKRRLPCPTNAVRTRGLRAASLLLSACALLTMPACVSEPTVKVHTAQVTGVGPIGISLNVVVKVFNDNSFDIMIRRVTARTLLAGHYRLPEVTVHPNVWLPANKTTYVNTPVVVPWPLVPGVLATTMGNESVSYHVQGTADVSATRTLGVQVNNETIDEQGVVPREVMLRAARTTIPGAR
ncbi:MAG: LEA type 2 family protein [Myxococcota bacterium]